MLKGIDKINNYLNKWLKDNDFDVTVAFSTEFSFDNYNDILYYAFAVTETHNDAFLKVCSECREEIVNIDNFLLSFFHELGHYETLDDISQSVWDDYLELTDKLNKIKEPTLHDLDTYYHHPVEIKATQWGCDYILEHEEECRLMLLEVSELIQEFYKLNDVEIE